MFLSLTQLACYGTPALSKADERRAAIVAQQAAREKAERDARGDTATPAAAKKVRPPFRRGPGRPPRPRDDS
jgi:hypothetical protein